MTTLLKKDTEFQWNEDHDKEFQSLKKAVEAATVLKYPNHDLPYRVYTDACNTGIGAALCQVDKEGVEFPIAFISRKLNKAEFNWAMVDKELLAVTYALFKFRKYLLDQEFTVFTDM